VRVRRTQEDPLKALRHAIRQVDDYLAPLDEPGRSRTIARTIAHVPRLTTLAGVLLSVGDTVECPCCGASFARFCRGPAGTPNRRCWRCGSLERHRQLALLFRSRRALLRPGMRILHIAPEQAVRRLLPTDCDYVAGDLDPAPGERRIDVTDMREFADETFDAVICNHVMEHVPDDRAAMREFRRVLRRGGWAILMTPIVIDATVEDATVVDPAERLRQFGQVDHVRRYGWDYVDRLQESGLSVEVVRQDDELSAAEVERYRLRRLQGDVEPIFIARRA
jgi:SAM-dependent methyltransferase